MIEKIRLMSFQGHKDVTLEFGMVTSIVGATDAGKSSIIRALGLVCLNNIRGNYFVKEGEENAKVALLVDGHKVQRIKGKDNYYKLGAMELRAFGTSTVPDNVKELLNVNLSNFQFQFDSPFWLSDTPGAVSKKLNDIAGLNSVDRSLSVANSKIRKEKALQSVLEDELQKVKSKQKELKWTVKAVQTIEEMERVRVRLEGIEVEISDIRDCSDKVKASTEQIEKTEGELNVLARMADKAKELLEIESKIRELERLVTKIKEIPTIRIPNIEELQRTREKADSVAEECSEVEVLTKGVQNQIKDLKEIKRELKYIRDKIDKETEGMCPLCKKPMREK